MVEIIVQKQSICQETLGFIHVDSPILGCIERLLAMLLRRVVQLCSLSEGGSGYRPVAALAEMNWGRGRDGVRRCL